jgi:ferrochelatase
MATAGRSGVLIVGFGAPDSLEAVGPFMLQLTGREPSETVLQQVRMRYLAIGGGSPLLETAQSIAAALSSRLEEEKGSAIPVAVGMRYSAPSIGDAVSELVSVGVDHIVLCPLSPFESNVTHGAYRAALADELREHPEVFVTEAPPIGALDAFAELVAASALSSLERLESAEGSLVVFTAHSLPLSDLTADDPYVAGIKSVLGRTTEYLGWQPGREGVGDGLLEGISTFGALDEGAQKWVLAYSSKGMRGGEWLGPDAEAVVDAAHAAGLASIVAVPVGFLTDHLETLYDLDIELADKTLGLGMEFVRGPVANDHEHLIRALAQSIGPLL